MQVAAVAMMVSSLVGFVSSMSAADDQEDLARQNAANEAAEAEEALRQEQEANRQEEALNRARAAASGIDPDVGSSRWFQEDQKRQNRLREDWIIRSGRSRSKIAHETGMTQAKATRVKGYGHIAEGISAGADTGWFG